MSQQTHYRACHLCEAICGLEIVTDGPGILSIKGDHNDPFSRGHICPKAIALRDLHQDPDRLREPMKKVDGQWQKIPWEQAIEEVAQKTAAMQHDNGANSVGVYAGNPNVHNYGNITHGRMLRKALRTKNNFSATSLDQLPHHLAALQLFGHQFMVPVPDIDHTDYMLILGANPLASNGSMMTVPDVKKRLQAIQTRGGRFVVIDPRRSETAELADEHVFIKPGSDAFLLLAMLNVLFDNDSINLGHLENLVVGLNDVKQAVAGYTPELASKMTGVDSDVIRRLADEFSQAKSAVCYGRMGVSTQAFGSVCQWAIQVINIVTGNLDRVGGAMVPTSAVGNVQPGEPAPGHLGRYHTRVSGLPEFSGEFPVSALAEEILTDGEGQIKALFTLAGNPVLSAPNGRRLDKAFESLEFMVAIDIYVNETTQHADYILPPTGPLEHDHYDFSFFRLAIRNTTRFNEPVFEPPKGALHDWEILNQLGQAITTCKGEKSSALPPPHVLIDMGLQQGPYSAKAGHDQALSLNKLKANPHGIDLGALVPTLTQRLCTDDGLITLMSEVFEIELARLAELSDSESKGENEGNCKGETNSLDLKLIGRRHVRSNNSWMHNYHRLVKGKPRWQCLMHPDDMKARAINDGANIVIKSRVGEITTEVKASDEMMPGVISIPHGWGHQRQGIQLGIASQQGGKSANDLTDDQYYDQSTGNAALNGVPVAVIAM